MEVPKMSGEWSGQHPFRTPSWFFRFLVFRVNIPYLLPKMKFYIHPLALMDV